MNNKFDSRDQEPGCECNMAVKTLINHCFQSTMVKTTLYPSYIDAKKLILYIRKMKKKMLLAFFHLTGHALTWFMCLYERTASWSFFLKLLNGSNFFQERTLWDKLMGWDDRRNKQIHF
jgi:hypothetical protein